MWPLVASAFFPGEFDPNQPKISGGGLLRFRKISSMNWLNLFSIKNKQRLSLMNFCEFEGHMCMKNGIFCILQHVRSHLPGKIFHDLWIWWTEISGWSPFLRRFILKLTSLPLKIGWGPQKEFSSSTRWSYLLSFCEGWKKTPTTNLPTKMVIYHGYKHHQKNKPKKEVPWISKRWIYRSTSKLVKCFSSTNLVGGWTNPFEKY